MAKRGYKLQEFVAHSANVNCIKIGKKTHRHFITGGDDEMVNLWSVGQSTSITSLSGHTSPVESVAFDPTEVLVAAGASSGVIKLWDLEETKVVRTLNGHRSYCTAVEFHPFGEFFASGSMDTNLKIWDIRKKGCIHTYKGHRRAISTIRSTPDGRWVVSGGLDNVVKIWDLTAGKLLHELKFHEGHIRSIDFHPLEFLLATGSSDRTVKFWDLETFELVGSTRPEETGVRSITFHPDGRTLFCGLDSSLKVYSWEPVKCRDTVDMGWSTLGDICIDDGKLLGCSYYQNSIGVWVADVSQIALYGHGMSAEENTCLEPKSDIQESCLERVDSPHRSIISLDEDTTDIKNIYVDTAGVTPLASRKDGSLPKAVNLTGPKGINVLPMHKHVPAAKNIEQHNSFFVYGIVPRDNSDTKDLAKSGRELFVGGQDSTGVSFKPSSTKLDVEELSASAKSVMKGGSDTATNTNVQRRLFADDAANVSSEKKATTSTCVGEEFPKASPPRTPSEETCDGSVDSNKGLKSIKYVNGVAMVDGRTRSLVEKFERREKLNPDECQKPDLAPQILPNTDNMHAILAEQPINAVPCAIPEAQTSPMPVMVPDVLPCEASVAKTAQVRVRTPDVMPCRSPEAKTIPLPVKRPGVVSSTAPEAKTSPMLVKTPDSDPEIKSEEVNSSPLLGVQRLKTYPNMLPKKAKASSMQRSVASRHVVPEKVRLSPMLVVRRSRASAHMTPERTKITPLLVVPRHDTSTDMTPEKAKVSPLLDDNPQTTGRGLTSKNDDDEDLMQDHDRFLSTLRSRLTKLQVVHHFWQRNDMRAAINALQKLPDHAVQADVLSVMTEKIESLTLDLFSGLLPMLLGLLDSDMERHINVSLEMLSKLVAVFGPVVSATVSAPQPVGVDLHAEKRLECCNHCHAQLQKIQKSLPNVIRRGGLPARCAQELKVILQQS